MIEVIKPVYYEIDGAGAAGLTPTAQVVDIRTDKIVATVNVVELGIAGFYQISFKGHEQHEYAVLVDAGVDTVGDRRQAFSVIALSRISQRDGGGSTKIVSTTLSKKDKEDLLNSFVENFPELKIEGMTDHSQSLIDIQNKISLLGSSLNSLKDEVIQINLSESIDKLREGVEVMQMVSEELPVEIDMAIEDFTEMDQIKSVIEYKVSLLSNEEKHLFNKFKEFKFQKGITNEAVIYIEFADMFIKKIRNLLKK